MKKISFIAIVVFITAISTGCFTTATVRTVPAHVDVTVYTVIPIAPPPVVVTTGPGYIVQPSPRYVWIDGYWLWDPYRATYTWVNGYWSRAPYTGAIWVPGYWEYRPAGYVWIGPTWLPRGYSMPYGYYDGRYDYFGRPVYYPRPPVYASGNRGGYSYSYDHRPQYTGREYSSYSDENNRGTSGRTPIGRDGGTQGRNPTGQDEGSGRTTTQPTQNEGGGRTPTTQPTQNEGSGRTPTTKPTQNEGSGRTPTTQPTQPTQNQGGTPGRTPTTQPTQNQENPRQNPPSGGNTGGRR